MHVQRSLDSYSLTYSFTHSNCIIYLIIYQSIMDLAILGVIVLLAVVFIAWKRNASATTTTIQKIESLTIDVELEKKHNIKHGVIPVCSHSHIHTYTHLHTSRIFTPC